MLTSREGGDPIYLEFLNGCFGGPLKDLSWVDSPWIETLRFPEVLVVDGERVS